MRWFLPMVMVAACTGGPEDGTTPPDTAEETGDTGTIVDYAEVQVLSYERSFGECIGACVTTLSFADDQVTLELREHDGTSAGGGFGTMTASTYADFQALEDALPGGLPEVSGCPDCDDGGAEAMTLQDPEGGTTTYSWEFGAPPAEAAAIDALFDAFVGALSTCTSSDELTVALDCTADQ